MKRDYILGILFFSGLWGISEAVLGGALYGSGVRFASVFLTVIAFSILAFAKVCLPRKGTATLIAALAMLYKFLNAPFFACHLLGIVLIGLSFDLFFSLFKLKSRAFSAAAAVYLSYILFALMITYIFRYDYWAQGGFSKLLSHIGIGGSVAALCCAVFVPVCFRLAQRFKAGCEAPFTFRWRLVPGAFSAITTGLWVFGVAVYVLSI